MKLCTSIKKKLFCRNKVDISLPLFHKMKLNTYVNTHTHTHTPKLTCKVGSGPHHLADKLQCTLHND